MGRRKNVSSPGAKILRRVQRGAAITMAGPRRCEEGEGVRGKVQERDGRARGKEMDPEEAKQSRKGRLPRSKRKSPRRARRSSHGRGREAAKEKRMGEEGAEVEAREKSHGGPKVVQPARRSPRDREAGRGVKGDHRDREVGAKGDQEDQEADLAVDPVDHEAGRKVDQRRNPSEDPGAVRGAGQRKSLKKHDGQDHPRGHPLIPQHPKARRRRRGSQDRGAPLRGRGERNKRREP